MSFRRGILFVVTLLIIGVLAACGNGDAEDASSESAAAESTDETIDMGQISWAENIAVTNMWKVILEEEGYDVEFHLLDMGTQMAALANDELDVNLEFWLPVQDKNYFEKYEEEIDFSEEVWYDNAKVGLVVPAYMEDINSIEDLNENKELFESRITGFDPGAGTMDTTEDMIAEYELDFELIPSSEPAMLTAIEEAIRAEEPIVAPLWNPHRVFSEMDLKYLDDPKNMFGETEKIHHAKRLGFADDYPEVDQWLKNWKMDDDSIGALMSYVAEAEEAGEDPIVGAEKWVDENQDLVNEWLSE
ncbi:glycine betaine ABC transporter substrate-binding protein [Oceanobacillus alkalisoli]|uniref:glycine betaine ABC transporter substrate-binding protein n=1 Tax=Oceanobacillus alkalisoli TaxID=2925113 RepID=UPI001F11CE52|nr:glycine betaine ABC transporter substrate-binding protein [Oceanobacillus alkalisoli]MCF3942832.1 glycine betaine ABC transporter substrate-binding protein [Oceanobacillus alkalisoli]